MVLSKSQSKFAPNKIKFNSTRPPGRLQSRAVPSQGGSTVHSEVKALYIKLEKKKSQIKSLEAKKHSAIAPTQKKQVVSQLTLIKKDVEKLQKELSISKVQARVKTLSSACDSLNQTRTAILNLSPAFSTSPPEKKQAEISQLKQEFLKPEKNIKPVYMGKIAPQAGEGQIVIKPFIDEQMKVFQSLKEEDFQSWSQIQKVSSHFKTSLKDNGDVATQEKKALVELSEHLEKVSSLYFDMLNLSDKKEDSPGASEDSFSPLSLDFDVPQAKSERPSYETHIQLGFGDIYKASEQEFRDQGYLKSAIESFLKAVSINKERFEAYFGLGYVYILVQDIEHGLYFLDIAKQISEHPAIDKLIQQVQA